MSLQRSLGNQQGGDKGIFGHKRVTGARARGLRTDLNVNVVRWGLPSTHASKKAKVDRETEFICVGST